MSVAIEPSKSGRIERMWERLTGLSESDKAEFKSMMLVYLLDDVSQERFEDAINFADLRTVRPEDFLCRVCGRKCDTCPPKPGRAVCELHCEDHDYRYERGQFGHYCIHCNKKAPDDWYDDID